MDALTALRLTSIVAWFIVAVALGGSAYRAVTGKTYAYDNFRACFFFVALLMLGFNGRWLVAPNDRSIWVALYALSVLVAFFILRVARAHGRGGDGR